MAAPSDVSEKFAPQSSRIGVELFSILLGNEILASFGYPKGHENDAERAVHAGLDLVERVGQLRSQSGDALQVRIAIATGLVLTTVDR